MFGSLFGRPCPSTEPSAELWAQTEAAMARHRERQRLEAIEERDSLNGVIERLEVLEIRLRSVEASLAAVAGVMALEFGGDE
jgi:hypothetical protein